MSAFTDAKLTRLAAFAADRCHRVVELLDALAYQRSSFDAERLRLDLVNAGQYREFTEIKEAAEALLGGGKLIHDISEQSDGTVARRWMFIPDGGTPQHPKFVPGMAVYGPNLPMRYGGHQWYRHNQP